MGLFAVLVLLIAACANAAVVDIEIGSEASGAILFCFFCFFFSFVFVFFPLAVSLHGQLTALVGSVFRAHFGRH